MNNHLPELHFGLFCPIAAVIGEHYQQGQIFSVRSNTDIQLPTSKTTQSFTLYNNLN